MRRLLLSLALLAPGVALAQSTDHPSDCDHHSSACVYNTYRVLAHKARKAKDLPGMVTAARYGVKLFDPKRKRADVSHRYAVLNTLLRLHEDYTPTTDAERQAIEDGRALLGQHYGWKQIAGKWRDPDDIREVMGWEKHGAKWWPKAAWKLHRQIDKQNRLVKRKVSETGGDISSVQWAQEKLDKLQERRRKLGGKKRQAEANIKAAKKKLPELRKTKEKLKKAYDADPSNAEAKKAWQRALFRVRGVHDDIMLEEARLKDVKSWERKLPGEIKKARKELKQARKKLGPGYRKVAPALKKLDALRAKLAAAWSKAESEWQDDALIEKRLKAHDKKAKTPKKR